jgi:hypothetical protein
MSIDDLRARQDAVRAAAAFWHAFIERLSKEFDAGLLIAETRVRAMTGLELSAKRSSLVHESNENLAHFNQRPVLELQATHLRDEQIWVSSLHCTYTGHADGLFHMHAYEFRDGKDNSTLTFESRTVAAKPWIPLRVVSRKGRESYIWWCGPEDNDKLAKAIVSAFANQEMKSDLILLRKPSKSGCALLAACLTVSVVVLAKLWI